MERVWASDEEGHLFVHGASIVLAQYARKQVGREVIHELRTEWLKYKFWCR